MTIPQSSFAASGLAIPRWSPTTTSSPVDIGPCSPTQTAPVAALKRVSDASKRTKLRSDAPADAHVFDPRTIR